MGLIRKAASLSTLGIISYRTDAESARRMAKQTRNAARANVVQNMQLIELQRQALATQQQGVAMQAATVAALTPAQTVSPSTAAGLFPDPSDPQAICYWTGSAWAPETKRYPG